MRSPLSDRGVSPSKNAIRMESQDISLLKMMKSDDIHDTSKPVFVPRELKREDLIAKLLNNQF